MSEVLPLLPAAFRLVLVAVGAICAVAGCWVFYSVRSRVGVIALIAYLTCGFGISLFPPDNGQLLDQVSGVPGLGLLLLVFCLQLGVVLQGLYATRLEGTAATADWLLVAVWCVMMAGLTTLWAIARAAAGRDLSRLFYQGYYGRPAALLLWNIALGASIVFVCAAALRLQRRHPDSSRDQNALTLLFVYGVGAGEGVLVAAQAVCNGLGVGGPATSLRPVMILLFVLAAVVAAAQTLWIYFIYPAVVSNIAQWRLLVRTHDAMRRIFSTMVDLHLVLSERLVESCTLDDGASVRAVAAYTETAGLPLYRQRGAVEAVRWIVFRRSMIGARHVADGRNVSAAAVAEAIASDAAGRVLAGTSSFDSDIWRIVVLVLACLYSPEWSEQPQDRLAREPWHADLAARIAAILTAPTLAPERERGRARLLQSRAIALAWGLIKQVREAQVRLSPRRLQGEIIRLQEDVRDMTVVCSERLIHLYEHMDAALVDDVDAWCRTGVVPVELHHIAREAAHWLSLFPPSALRAAHAVQEPCSLSLGSVSLAPGDLISKDTARFAHVRSVLVAALGAARLPILVSRHPEPDGWHLFLAHAIVEAMPQGVRQRG